jgi:hypothetical protein
MRLNGWPDFMRSQWAGKLELPLLALMLRVKMSGLVFPVVHPYNDAEEDRNNRA